MEQKRLGYLDSLRGLAAASVAFKHHLLVFGVAAEAASALPYLPFNYYLDGSPEVCFFFVLSGFVLSVKSFGPAEERLSLGRSYLSRVMRIYPAFFAVFLLSLGARALGYLHPASAEHVAVLTQHWPLSVGWSEYLHQLPLLSLWSSSERGMPIVPPDWTLMLEINFSLALPFLIVIARQSPWWLLTALGFALASSPDSHFLGFGLGVLVASLYRYAWPRLAQRAFFAKLSPAKVNLASLAVLGLVVAIYYSVQTTLYWRSYTCSIAAVLVLSVALASRGAQRILDWAPLRFLGKVSYSLYLCHFLVFISMAPYWRTWLAGVPGAFYLDLLFCAIACVALSAVLYQVAEMPGVALGKRLARLLPRPTGRPAANRNVSPPPTKMAG